MRNVDTPSIRRRILNPVVNGSLEVVVVHQPAPQRIDARVTSLLVEDAAVPLPANVLLNFGGRCSAVELHLHQRTAA